jgi:cobalt/nickel transport system permease protein
VHRLPAHCKIAAHLAFVLVVVCTPRETFWPYAAYAVLLAGVALAARVPPGFLARRLVIEVPFVLFALALPFLANGPRVDVLGLSLSESGLMSAWGILAKATLGVLASVLLAATTTQRDLLLGLERLGMPQPIVQIASFMLRYADVIAGESERMRIARESRGFTPRHLGHLPVVARSAGALFVRSYERGERVHLAMLSRGYTGSMPRLDVAVTPVSAWAKAAVLPLLAACALAAGWATR